MDKELDDFKNNKVYLWGLTKASDKLLTKYDKGNRNPRTHKNEKEEIEEIIDKKEKKIEKKITNEFDETKTYDIDDLEWLNEEYDKLEKLIEENENDNKLQGTMDKLEEIIINLSVMRNERDENERISTSEKNKIKWDKINKLEKELDDMRQQYIESHGNAKYKPLIEDLENRLSLEHKNIIKGGKIEKGSEQAKEIGKRLSEARKLKKEELKEKNIKTTKARVDKGSEQAKEIGKRLSEARKLKKEVKEEIEIQPKEIKDKKIYYYIGNVPKGYREATEDEAIEKKKVSKYGKYLVDNTKYTFFNNFNILLSYDLPIDKIKVYLNVLKKKILYSLEEIEIFKSKIDNPKYENSIISFNNKLIDETYKVKLLRKGYNWLYKLYCQKMNKEYIKPIIKLPEKHIPVFTPSNHEYKEKEIIDFRKSSKEPKYYNFKNDFTELSIPSKAFENDILKSKYALKLYLKHIILSPDYYTDEDKEKYFLKKNNIEGGNIVKRKPSDIDLKHKDILQSIIFDKSKWTIPNAKKWLKKNNYYSDSIDINKKQIRFRQFNPEDLLNRHFISKKLDNGIMFIFSILTPLKIEQY